MEHKLSSEQIRRYAGALDDAVEQRDNIESILSYCRAD